MYLIAGLGNPGSEYEETRHNIGFKVIDRLSKDLSIDISKNHCRAVIGQGLIGNTKVILAKPLTYMNLSGESIRELLNWYKITVDHIIVINDDLDIEIGNIKIKGNGNSAGHNGIESIIGQLKTTEFIRIRVGIGRSSTADSAQYVLAKIPDDQRETIGVAINNAADAAQMLIKDGLDAAMNKYNQL